MHLPCKIPGLASPDVDAALRQGQMVDALHYELIHAMEGAGCLGGLVLHGAAALHMAHGSTRLTGNLDFLAGPDLDQEAVLRIRQALRDQIPARLLTDMKIRTQHDMRFDPVRPRAEAQVWELAVTVSPRWSAVPVCTNIRLSDAVAENPVLMGLKRQYDFQPMSCGDLLLKVCSPAEILLDKVIALATCLDGHAAARHIWDMVWLTRQGAPLDREMLRAKAERMKLAENPDFLPGIGRLLSGDIPVDGMEDALSEQLSSEQRRRTFGREGFDEYLRQTVLDCIGRAKGALIEPDAAPEDDFVM